MAKFNHYSISKEDKNKILNELYFVVGSLKNKEQIINFFNDILTKSELIMLARRIQIARMLIEGQSYWQISRKLKTGIDTIMRVQRWLKDGFGDYIKSLEKISKNEQQRIKQKELREARRDIDPNSLEGLANRYPLYFGLTNAISKIMGRYGEKINKENQKRKKK